jgi:hypothetical protein
MLAPISRNSTFISVLALQMQHIFRGVMTVLTKQSPGTAQELRIINPNPKYLKPDLVEPTTFGYIYIGASVEPSPNSLGSAERQEIAPAQAVKGARANTRTGRGGPRHGLSRGCYAANSAIQLLPEGAQGQVTLREIRCACSHTSGVGRKRMRTSK